MKINKLVKMATSSLWANKVRAFLTMLGIIIGISSVIILVGIGQGTKQQVASQIESLGTNLITVNITGNRNKAISEQEIAELKKMEGIKDISPVLSENNVDVKAGNNSIATNIQSTTSSYSTTKKVGVQMGRFINEIDLENRFKVAVVGVEVAQELFGSTNVLGKDITINGVNFSIVGVLQSKGNSTSGSEDNMVILPLTTGQRVFKTKDIRMFYVEAEDKDKVDKAMAFLQLFLNKKYNNDTKSYRIFDQTSLLETANATNDSMTLMLSGVAAISLIVGGIGIMNIMLVSVIERTKEIGIRKAIGAKRKDILVQFLIESSLISTLGGVIGVILGFGGGYIAEKLFSIPIGISSSVVIGAFVFSAVVGIIFGMYPANRASKLNPIEALRFE